MPRLSPLTLRLAAALFCFGGLLFIFGPCLTAMSETFRVPLARFVLLWTCYAVGLLPAVLLTGSFSEVAGRRIALLLPPSLLAAIGVIYTARTAGWRVPARSAVGTETVATPRR